LRVISPFGKGIQVGTKANRGWIVENGPSDSLIGSASSVSVPADGSAIMVLRRLVAASLLTFGLGLGWARHPRKSIRTDSSR
jgi:hypothetical protein